MFLRRSSLGSLAQHAASAMLNGFYHLWWRIRHSLGSSPTVQAQRDLLISAQQDADFRKMTHQTQHVTKCRYPGSNTADHLLISSATFPFSYHRAGAAAQALEAGGLSTGTSARRNLGRRGGGCPSVPSTGTCSLALLQQLVRPQDGECPHQRPFLPL